MKSIPDKAELGCGEKKPEGRYGVDQLDTCEADKIIDLDSQDWDLPENHFTFVRAKDLFEHLDNPVNFLENLHEILCPEGIAEIHAPHLASRNWTDPTHKRLVGIRTIQYYFTDCGKHSYYTETDFEVLNRRITFPKRKINAWAYILELLVNYSDSTQEIYEDSILSNIFHSENVVFRIQKPRETDSSTEARVDKTFFQSFVDWLPFFSETCENCGGSGRVDGNVDHSYTCRECGGAGFV